MSALVSIEDLMSRFGSRVSHASLLEHAPRAQSLGLDWPELEAALPDGGLPRGVVELASPRAIGGPSAIALSAIRAAHARDARAWCAWIDPEATLYAPGVAMAGVDWTRLLVVRPPRAELARIAVKVARARAFDVIAIDMDALPGAMATESRRSSRKKVELPIEVLIRKFSILAEEGGSTILLLTDARAPRAVPWPVALRLEISRGPESIAVRVAKDRRGRIGVAKTVPMKSRPTRLTG